jgi:hypothetical protein
MAWQDFHDYLNGDAWSSCSQARNDPCSCFNASDGFGIGCGSGGGGANPIVPCTATNCSILSINLPSVTGMEGRTLPSSIGDMKELVSFNIGGCYVAGAVPVSFKSLTKLKGFQIAQNRFTYLPDLPFKQYEYAYNHGDGFCDVCDNPFVCPLPPGAADCVVRNDCPPSCVAPPGQL